MWGLKIAGMVASDVVAQHAIWLLPIGLVAGAVALVFLAPTAALAIFRFLSGTLAGQILSAIVITALCTSLGAWWLRGYVDAAAERTRAVIAERAATKAAEDKQKEAEAQFAELRRQVEASDKLVADFRANALANEAALESYQQRETDYEAALAKRPALGDALTDDDVRSLRSAAAAYRGRAGGGPAAGPGKLRPPRPGP